MDLALQKCTTYRAGSPPLTRRETMELLAQVPGWSLENGHISKSFPQADAASCIAFFGEIANLATEEGHIPDICMKESRLVTVSLYTYPAGGLTLNDFIMAAKLNNKASVP
jgi:4a-hydroxytetrahydrobiopterin dehydratase